MRTFRDRAEAGRALAETLVDRLAGQDVVVLGLPRGGVPVAAPVAQALSAPLDVFVVRKLGAPGQPELAIGAVASGGVRVLNDGLLRALAVTPAALARVTANERSELDRREWAYRGGRAPAGLAGRTVVLVDDGLATGATACAAVEAVRGHRPHRVVAAVPVGSPEACARLEQVADEVVCLAAPESFRSVGAYYADFGQTSDAEVRHLLSAARAEESG